MNTLSVVIIEDEALAARRLGKMLADIDPSARVVAVLDSIEASVGWLAANPRPGLILMDIELVDGQSFEIFDRVAVDCPVIFTTAYDEYAIRAFKVNSIDYLLKPVAEKDLRQSLEKLGRLRGLFAEPDHARLQVASLLRELTAGPQAGPAAYRDRILVKQGQRLFSITTAEVAYFCTREKLNYVRVRDGRQYLVDYSLDELEKSLDPRQFFRANRQFIAGFGAVERVSLYFNGKLKVILNPVPEEDVVISRDKAAEFRQWLGE
jgi:two-component system LytT family response regulator